MGGVTVREVLTLPALRGSYIAAGLGGLDRAVTGVNMMEVPDIESFVKPGELLLTTAYPLRDHSEGLSALVGTLDRIGLAALAVKTGRYIDQLPSDMLELADQLDFPVVILPDRVSFNEVIGAVLAVVLTEYGPEPDSAEAIRERLTGVTLAGGGLNEIARTLSGALDCQVSILDPEGMVLGSGSDVEYDSSELSWTFPITVASSERGSLVVTGLAEPSLGQRRLIRQACFAAAMHIAQALAGLELDRQMRVLFLEELVTGKVVDEAPVQERARLFGWDLSAPHRVAIAQCDVHVGNLSLAMKARRSLPHGSICWGRGHEVVALVPIDPIGENTSAAVWLTRWRNRLIALDGGDVVVATGSVASSAAGFTVAHDAARESLAIAHATGRLVVTHEALTLERVLRSVPVERLTELVDHAIGPLVAADQTNGSRLCETLEMYLGAPTAAEAARRLYIHYNTMKHRMARITDLLATDLHDPSSRLAVAVALRVRTLLPPS
jgi:purine catabolism regulator